MSFWAYRPSDGCRVAKGEATLRGPSRVRIARNDQFRVTIPEGSELARGIVAAR